MQSPSCRWSIGDVFIDDDPENDEDDNTKKARIDKMKMKFQVRMELTRTVMTFLSCRLLGEVLSFISIFGSSQKTGRARLVWIIWYSCSLATSSPTLPPGVLV